MQDETKDRRRDLLWALPTSLVLHVLLIAILVVHGQPRPQQQEEQAVNVTLVPPPEQPKPKPAPPPPPKEPAAEKPPEPKVERPPVPDRQPPEPARIEVLKPVFQFGDKDAGPGKTQEGGGVQAASPPSEKADDPKSPPVAMDSKNEPDTPSGSEERPDPAKEAEKQAAEAKDAASVRDAEKNATTKQDLVKQETDKPAAPADETGKQTAAAPAQLDAAGGDGEIALPALAQAPQPRPENAPKPNPAKYSKPASGSAGRPKPADVAVAASQPYSGLPGVRRPQSQGGTGDALATTSMAGVPRDKRAAQLCASVLQQQLLEASYSPDLVPLVPLKAGNVLDVPEAAFRTRTAWHDLSFRCEVDSDATTVLSFTFRVGTTIPRDQWARLGLPMR